MHTEDAAGGVPVPARTAQTAHNGPASLLPCQRGPLFSRAVSCRYPIKEPFVELMKGSLNTFLNAFTYPDRTCYPVASTNTQVVCAAWSVDG